MSDQAQRLRTLMHAGERHALGAAAAGAPRLVAIAGAKGGVGTTSVTVNLSVALARDGRRTLLIDANRQHADVATQCGLADGPGLADVLAGRRSLHEAIQLGPAGIQVVSGPWGSGTAADWTATAQQRLVRDLRALGPHADMILLDVGAAIDATARTLWRSADEVVLVTTPDSVAVMDAYAAVKSQCDASEPVRLATLVNQSTDSLSAQDAHSRLQRACHRFLGIDVRALGSISSDEAFRAAATAVRPLVVHAPTCAAAQELSRIAERLGVAAVESRNRSAPAIEGARRSAVNS